MVAKLELIRFTVNPLRSIRLPIETNYYTLQLMMLTGAEMPNDPDTRLAVPFPIILLKLELTISRDS